MRIRPEEAKPVLEELVRKYPQNFEETETLGLIYSEGGNLSSGLPFLEKSCAIHPSCALAQSNLGAAYLKLNRIEDAIRALKRSAALEPKIQKRNSSSDPRVHFGWDSATDVEKIEILWPSGRTQQLSLSGIDEILTIKQGVGVVPD